MAHIFVTEQPGPVAAPRVVFVHGSLDRSTAFLRVARLLPELSTVRYDRRGYGKSIAVGSSPVFDVQVDDLAGVVGGRPSVLLGHSIGGGVGLAFAARHPELVGAVVAYEAPMSWEPWWPQATAGAAALAADGVENEAAEQFMRRMIGDDRWESLPDATKRQRRAEGPALVDEMRSIRPPSPTPYDPTGLRVPVIAACGSASRPHHQQTARALAALAPAGELQVVDGAGHGAHLSHPAAVAHLVRVALARASKGVGAGRGDHEPSS
jgi:pimeloyl-ACP methyl ester carboxylesterase